MTLYVFLGPSLPLAEARALCPAAVCLPPVRLGDVHRCVAFGGATAIGIIDGYFERVPAVWHKEILWALSRGVAVFGAASMGALRAAELAAFGMVGIGRIYEAYRSGVFMPFADEPFEDDDEVAVEHAPAEAGWMATEAMVNIRATLAAAGDADVLPAGMARRLAALAKALFYKERSWATLLRRAEAVGEDASALAGLRTWLPQGRIDQKRADAAALLRCLDSGPLPKPGVCFSFADTTLWRRATALPAGGGGGDGDVLVELRLRGADVWHAARDAAWAELVGEPASSDDGSLPDLTATDPAGALAALETFACRESRHEKRAMAAAPLLDAAILRLLHRDGRYDELAGRAAAKRRLTAAPATCGPPAADALLAWFAARSDLPVPVEADRLADSLDFADADDLLHALAGEWRLVNATA